MKIDPYKTRRQYLRWKERALSGKSSFSNENLQVVLEYLDDLETGRNLAPGTKKGPRTYSTIDTARKRLEFLARHFKRRLKTTLTSVSEDALHEFFRDMRSGTIRKRNGEPYKGTSDYVRVFRSFWNWHLRVQRKNGVILPDICYELDTRREKPQWVYLTPDEVKKLCRVAKWEYRVLMMFLYDTGIRSPSELINIRAQDVREDCQRLTIRDEISKTFGRTIKLLLCSDVLKDYIEERNLKGYDQLFPVHHRVVNRYLRSLAKRVLGDEVSPAGQRYSQLTLYDFRHSSACYWVPRYKTESALKFRFGWKRSAMIHYYTEFLGMRDTITHEDLQLDDQKTKFERELESAKNQSTLLEEQVSAMDQQVKVMLRAMNQLKRPKARQRRA